MWKWERHFYANIPEGKIALNINLDETSIQLWQSRHRGNVAFRKWRSVRKVRTKFASKASLKAQRSNLTHVAMVCDKTDIQGRLPQFLLASHKVLLARDVPRVNAILPRNVFLIRSRSSWSNEATMKEVLMKLVENLADVMNVYQPILFMDTAPCHLHASLFDYLGRNGIFLGFVPSAMTWLLQVLDFTVFALFKRFFKLKFHAKRAVTPSGELSPVDVIELLVLSIRKILDGNSWADSFASLGFSDSQSQVNNFVLQNLELTRLPAIGNGKPTNAEIQCMWPKNRRPHFEELFRWKNDEQPALLALPAPVAPALPLQLPSSNLPALPTSANWRPGQVAPASGGSMPHVITVAPKRRNRVMPRSFAGSSGGAASSTDPVDPLDQLLQDQAHIYAWLGNGDHVAPT